MKIQLTPLLILCAVTVLVMTPAAFAQRQLGKKKGPTSKLYIAETTGASQIKSGDKVYTVRQASAFDAPGTVIETSENSSTALVYSNGVGMVIGENSRIEVTKFDQAPFSANTATAADSNQEPSVSQSEIFLSRGTVGISTSEFLSGSSMACATELGAIKIRGGNIAIESRPEESIFDLLQGAATVVNNLNGQSYALKPGDRIIIRREPGGKQEVILTRIPAPALPALNAFLTIASNSRRTVTFEVIEQKAMLGSDAPPPAAGTTAPAGGGETEAAATGSFESESTGAESPQEIVAKPTVPATLPINVVISADRLPGG